MALMIDTTGLASLDTEKTGSGYGPATLFAKDGPYAFSILEARAGKSERGNITLTLTMRCNDDDANGAVIYHSFVVNGKTVFEDSGRERENIHQLGQLLMSTGRPADYIADLVNKKQFDLEVIAGELKNKGCFARIARKLEDGQPRSVVRYFIKEELYQKAKKSGTNWRNDPVVGGGSGVSKTQNGVKKGQTAVTDQMAADV